MFIFSQFLSFNFPANLVEILQELSQKTTRVRFLKLEHSGSQGKDILWVLFIDRGTSMKERFYSTLPTLLG